MGNKISTNSSFNLRENNDLDQFISSINMLDGFYTDTTLSISSKCLVIINNLINGLESGTIYLMSGVEVHKDDNLIKKIEKLQFHCNLVRHLAVVNSAILSVEELVDLSNLQHLTSLTIDHVPIRFVQHLKKHRETLIRLSVHYSLKNLESLIDLCGRDHSFSDKWVNLHHLDVRYNHLRAVDDSVLLLTSLTVLDISRNYIGDLSFIKKIPTLLCLNASFNYVKSLPDIAVHHLQVLIIGYNYLDSLEGIKGFKRLSTLNVGYNMIATNDFMQQLKEMDYIKDLILKGNPLFYSHNYRKLVLDVVSLRVSARFAIDGKTLSKQENAYFRKRPIIEIGPAPPASCHAYTNVPVIVIPRGNPASDAGNNSSHSYTNRRINPQNILTQSASQSNTNDNCDDVKPTLRKISSPHDEKRIESFSRSGTMFESIRTTIVYPVTELCVTLEDNVGHSPCYIGDKTSNLFIVMGDNNRQTFINVSVQIFEHNLMFVDSFNVTVENVDLWTLMVVRYDSTFSIVDTDKILKLVFFASCDQEKEGSLVLCTRRVEFRESFEAKNLFDQLKMYLDGFSISYDNWDDLPLANISLNCTKCSTAFIPKSPKLRPFLCHKCTGMDFILKTILPASLKSTVPSLKVTRQRTESMLFPRKRKPTIKSSTPNVVIRAFGSTESLSNRVLDNMSVHSENFSGDETSYHTDLNESMLDTSKLLNLSSRSLKDLHPVRTDVTDHFSTECELSTPYCSNEQIQPFTAGSTPNDKKVQSMELNLERGMNNPIFDMDISIVPHECQEDNEAYALLKFSLKSPWVVHEESCDIKIHMHNSRKIDDRVQLYFLTRVVQSNEDLVSVSKVYLVYRSTTVATKALVVLTNMRLLIFHLLEKTSPSIEECIKQVCEFNLKSLQRLEYCLNNQWLELQFKNKPVVTFLIGDGDSTKNVGISITETVSEYTGHFSVLFSKEMEKLKCPQILSAMAKTIGDDAIMDTIFKSESYLILSSSVLACTERSQSEYAPKMIVIEAERIFFVTFAHVAKSGKAVFDLSRTISLFSLKNNIFIDSLDPCTLRMMIQEADQDQSVDIQFMSTHSRSKAAFCIDRMWKALFQMDVVFQLDNPV